MTTNLGRHREDLERLTKLSMRMLADIMLVERDEKAKKEGTERGQLFGTSYQRWYSEAHAVIRQVLPNRLREFETLYQGDEKRKAIDVSTYAIKDWLLGIRASENAWKGEKHFDDIAIVAMRFKTQHEVLDSAKVRFESSLLDIRQMLQADLFDTEVEAARELLKNGFLRAAGAVAGVVAERHLQEVCSNHSVSISRKRPTISTYNDALKDADVIDVPQWRFIQRLGDVRNLCDHNKDREPTKDEAAELIDSVDKLMKTVV